MCFDFYDEYLWVYFDLSVEILWVHVSLYYGGVGLDCHTDQTRLDYILLIADNDNSPDWPLGCSNL